jgi:hypothetical protein
MLGNPGFFVFCERAPLLASARSEDRATLHLDRPHSVGPYLQRALALGGIGESPMDIP